MKKITLLLLFIWIPVAVFCSSLNYNANNLQSDYASDFEETIVRHAKEKWGTDYDMVNYQINNQSDALFALINQFESSNTEIFTEALINWSYSGYKNLNRNLLISLSVVEPKQLIKFHSDWAMVQYEYENQSEAKQAISGNSLEGLEHNAYQISSKYPVEFEATIKKHAIEKWDSEYEMVVYTINKQSDSLMELINEFQSENSSILRNAVSKWTIRGYEGDTRVLIQDLDAVNLEQLIGFHCDWDMVLYEYEKQVEAK